jgi:non-ribosomal peptide synthetase component F
VQITWFRPPAGDDPGTLNLCYHAVDIAVVRGAAAEPAVRHAGGALDYATLLEQVAAFAGALRGLGVAVGSPVGVLLDDPFDELLAALAVTRLGAVVLALDPDRPAVSVDEHRPHLVVTSRRIEFAAHEPAACLLHGPDVEVETRDLDWDLAVRAGRTDPAPCASVAPGDPAYVDARTVPPTQVPAIEVPGHDSRLGRAVADLADRVPVDLTGAPA